MSDEQPAPDETLDPAHEDPAGEVATAEGAPEGGTAEAPARRRLNHAQWLEIRTKAELGVARVSELAREYGITPQAISQHLKHHGVTVGSKAAVTAAAIAGQTAAAVAAKVASFAEKRAERIEQTREFYYKAHSNLDALILKKIGDQVGAAKPLSELAGELKALQFAKRSLLIGRAERFHVLDADTAVDAASLPDLVIQDLTSDEIAEIQSGEDPLEGFDPLAEPGDA